MPTAVLPGTVWGDTLLVSDHGSGLGLQIRTTTSVFYSLGKRILCCWLWGEFLR